ncbi:MAG: tRNA lysidine(34) synthetase TilS [Clostridiales bacterium]|nr:tRNA lysidine(34) synthetase TilS [Clostridiales bacterium]
MDNILAVVANTLRDYKGKKLAVGVSGGRDSVCLLHAIVNCGEAEKSDVIAVHVNHGLREEADGDEAFVKEFCTAFGIKYVSFKADVKKESAEKGLTIEQAARNVRYGIFDRLLTAGETDVVLTAHHALDNAESVLMHIFRGSGLDGLCGMNNGRIVRPLLSVYPEEIERYVKANGLKFVTDKTNFMLDADRNFIRLKVIPLIEERYPSAVRAVNALSAESTGIKRYLDGEIDEALISLDGGAVVLSDKALSSPLAERYVRRAVSYFTLTDVTRDMVKAAAALVGKKSGAKAEMSCGVIAEKESGGIAFYIPREKYDGEKQVGLGANFIDGLAVDIEKSDKIKPENGNAVDLNAIEGGVLRFRRDGDLFTPFGGGSKKLKQYLIDKKIPRRLRDRIPLIARGNEILVIVGVEISDKVKVTADTRESAVITRRF